MFRQAQLSSYRDAVVDANQDSLLIFYWLELL
jgi:hypothetical protein